MARWRIGKSANTFRDLIDIQQLVNKISLLILLRLFSLWKKILTACRKILKVQLFFIYTETISPPEKPLTLKCEEKFPNGKVWWISIADKNYIILSVPIRPAFKNISSAAYIFFFIPLFTTSCTRSWGASFISDCINVFRSRYKAALALLRGCIVLGFLGTNTLIVSYVTILTSLVSLSPVFPPETFIPETFARIRIHYSPLTRIHSTGYCAHRTYCYGVFNTISFCFCNILRGVFSFFF